MPLTITCSTWRRAARACPPRTHDRLRAATRTRLRTRGEHLGRRGRAHRRIGGFGLRRRTLDGRVEFHCARARPQREHNFFHSTRTRRAANACGGGPRSFRLRVNYDVRVYGENVWMLRTRNVFGHVIAWSRRSAKRCATESGVFGGGGCGIVTTGFRPYP